MDKANSVTTYPSWALAAFTDWVLPALHRLSGDGLLTREWLDSCQPGESGATRLRLFPGSLFLIKADHRNYLAG